MKILALEREIPDISREIFQHFAEEEASMTWDLYQKAVIRALYFRTDQHTAVLELECASIEEARDTLANLPYVRERLISFDLIPLQAYSGFERLFKKTKLI